MPEFELILSTEAIRESIRQVAAQLSEVYRGRDVVIVGVLKGAFVFLADLVRSVDFPVKLDFIGVSSYGDSTHSSGSVRITKHVDMDLSGKDVLIVEDIVDTGLTLDFLVEHFRSVGAQSVRVCALIDKQERRSGKTPVDFCCHRVDKGFLVGYGLDYAEYYRNLPGIYHLKL